MIDRSKRARSPKNPTISGLGIGALAVGNVISFVVNELVSGTALVGFKLVCETTLVGAELVCGALGFRNVCVKIGASRIIPSATKRTKPRQPPLDLGIAACGGRVNLSVCTG